MKKIVVFRHAQQEDLGTEHSSWELPARLTPEGKERARQVTRKHREILAKCTHFFTSPLIRAQETLFVMMEELGHVLDTFDIKVKVLPGLWTENPLGWASSGPYETALGLWQKNPEFMEKEGERFLFTIKETSTKFPNNHSAFCVSHGGLLDAGLASAHAELNFTGILAEDTRKAFSQIRDLEKGEGVIFDFDEENFLLNVIELRS